jgi:hypothetical protein
MIEVNNTNILLLTIPRTGTHFVQHFLFESTGRIVLTNVQSWLEGKNPISYTPDHCLIIEHFHPTNTARIQEVIAADPDIRIIVPIRDLMQSFISAKTMGHKGFFPAIDEFVNTIDSIPHHKFILDGNDSKVGKLNSLLNYCGIASHDNKAKYIAWPKINSARPKDTITVQGNPNAALKRAVYDDAKLQYSANNIQGVRDYWSDVDTLINNTALKAKLAEFGYTDLSWL